MPAGGLLKLAQGHHVDSVASREPLKLCHSVGGGLRGIRQGHAAGVLGPKTVVMNLQATPGRDRTSHSLS